jgi:SAM-dependent methyltransferase
VLRFGRLFPFISLRRKRPTGSGFGCGRGQPIDRYFIERFLKQHEHDIQGRVLDIGDSRYTKQFGGEAVNQSEILHVTDQSSATIVADLANAPNIPSNTDDCIICTQTLQYIFDVHAAVRTIHRILKPQGTVLATVPCICQISRYDMDRWGDYWRFTSLSTRRLFSDVFSENATTIEVSGNRIAALAFVDGLVQEELRPTDLDFFDADYELNIAVRATKAKTSR